MLLEHRLNIDGARRFSSAPTYQGNGGGEKFVSSVCYVGYARVVLSGGWSCSRGHGYDGRYLEALLTTSRGGEGGGF